MNFQSHSTVQCMHHNTQKSHYNGQQHTHIYQLDDTQYIDIAAMQSTCSSATLHSLSNSLPAIIDI